MALVEDSLETLKDSLDLVKILKAEMGKSLDDVIKARIDQNDCGSCVDLMKGP